jgi:hypothetical protein
MVIANAWPLPAVEDDVLAWGHLDATLVLEALCTQPGSSQ